MATLPLMNEMSPSVDNLLWNYPVKLFALIYFAQKVPKCQRQNCPSKQHWVIFKKINLRSCLTMMWKRIRKDTNILQIEIPIGAHYVHTGLMPFHCKTCNKRFNHSSNLKIHGRIHTGEEPYECKRCGKRFKQTSSLKYHEKHHKWKYTYLGLKEWIYSKLKFLSF